MKPLRLATSNSVAFSPDSRLLATEDDRYTYIWDIAARQKVAKFRPFPWAGSPVFSPDGTRLALKSTSGRICVVEVPFGEVLSDFKNESDGEGCRILWSADGRYLVDGSWEGRLRVRNWSTGAVEFEQEYQGEMVRALSCSASGDLWLIEHAPRLQPGMSGDRPIPAPFLSLRSWPFSNSAEVILPLRLRTQFEGVALAPDGREFAVLHQEEGQSHLSIVSVGSSEIRTASLGEGSQTHSIAWSPDGRLLVAALTERRLNPDAPPRRSDAKTWDLTGYDFTRSAVVWDSQTLGEAWRLPTKHESRSAFSPDGRLLAVGASPGWLLASDF